MEVTGIGQASIESMNREEREREGWEGTEQDGDGMNVRDERERERELERHMIVLLSVETRYTKIEIILTINYFYL